MSDIENIDPDELERLVQEVLAGMEKHFSQENDLRYQQWDVPAPHVKLGRPQEVHGRRPGKRKMAIALRAAAKAQGRTSTPGHAGGSAPNKKSVGIEVASPQAIPKWNDLMQMSRKEIYRIGQKHFKGKFAEVLDNMPEAGAGDTPKVDEV